MDIAQSPHNLRGTSHSNRVAQSTLLLVYSRFKQHVSKLPARRQKHLHLLDVDAPKWFANTFNIA